MPTKRKTKTEQESPYFKKPKPTAEEAAKGVPDLLQPDLKVMFIGINPGLASAAHGHHYASPTNHFWPSLSSCSLVTEPVRHSQDETLPSRYQLGFTNLTARPSRRQSDLSLSEQREGIPLLQDKIRQFRPRVACFVGKGIFEIYSGKPCQLGRQPEAFDLVWEGGRTVVFVMPSTSGLVTAYKKHDRLRFFRELAELTEQQMVLYPVVKLEDGKNEETDEKSAVV